jgi:UDP-2,4-diacetamido-2,4,6-trideoxy-beta-L-altropyranose hydrolase
LLIRADADHQTGFGHVMRCIALGQEWRAAGGSVSFASRSLPGSIANRLEEEGMRWLALPDTFEAVGDAERFLQLADRAGAVALVADGYHLDSAWQQRVAASPQPLLLIDDEAQLDQYHATALLNQNLIDASIAYAGKFAGKLLAGPAFALLRREFLERRPTRGVNDVAAVRPQRLLVTLGGSEAAVITRLVLDAIQTLPCGAFEVTCLSGIDGLAGAYPQITVLPYARDMPAMMANSDLAICAGGSTNWEMCFFGIPRLVIALAGNQCGIAEALHARTACRHLGWHENVTRDQIAGALADLSGDAGMRRKMTNAGRELVDGQGARRVCETLRSLAGL